VEAAKLFLPADVTVVATVDRTGKPSPVLTFAKGPFAGQDRPTYVLVDKGTASAAEVFAAALQGNRAAKVVGERTYGKGLVQSIQRLTDSSAVVLTVAKYRTPQGEDINGKGIVPALPVVLMVVVPVIAVVPVEVSPAKEPAPVLPMLARTVLTAFFSAALLPFLPYPCLCRGAGRRPHRRPQCTGP
jgi:hypothetical protein